MTSSYAAWVKFTNVSYSLLVLPRYNIYLNIHFLFFSYNNIYSFYWLTIISSQPAHDFVSTLKQRLKDAICLLVCYVLLFVFNPVKCQLNFIYPSVYNLSVVIICSHYFTFLFIKTTVCWSCIWFAWQDELFQNEVVQRIMCILQRKLCKSMDLYLLKIYFDKLIVTDTIV